MTPTTPPVEAPAAPSATIAAAPLTPGSAQLVPEQGSPTLEQPDDSSPLPTQSDLNVEDAVEAEEVVEGGDYEVYMPLRCSCRCMNYELTQRFIAD